MKALSLFAGVGFGVACQRLGIHELGVENDPIVNATRDAAGMTTIGHDARSFARSSERTLEYELLTAGPPCQTFSNVGRGHGRRDLDTLVRLVHEAPTRSFAEVEELTADMDSRTPLVLVPLYVALRDRPQAIVLEQVPPVLPIWRAYADVLSDAGYSVDFGLLDAERFGVPQTRRRATLVARLGSSAWLPVPTHSRYHVRNPRRMDHGVLPWVSMADAMEQGGMGPWGEGVVGFPRKADGRDEGVEIRDVMYRSRDLRPTDRPAWGVTGKTRSWRRWGFTERPATVVTGHGIATRHPTGVQRAHLRAIEDGSFTLREPWTVSTARLPTFDNVSLSRSYHGEAVNITPEEGAVLQTFPADFPFQGSKTKVWQTIGNAVPVTLAERLIEAAISPERLLGGI